MSVSNNKISAPVDVIGDVSNVLIAANGDVAYLCSNGSGTINPASKCKPIRYPTPAELTDYNDATDQFMGTTEDNNNGIYYGVKIAAPTNNWIGLHDIALTYYPPRPGTDWCRITDFNRYNHNAQFSPSGQVYERSFVGQDIDVAISSNNNADCVNIADIVKNSIEKYTTLDLGDWYPCVLLSPTNKSAYFVRALWRKGGTGANAVSKFKVDGSYWTQWLIPVDNSSVGTAGYPESLLKSTGSILVTIFFAKNITAATIGLDLTKWNKIDTTAGLQMKQQAFACPNATGVTVQKIALFEAGVGVVSVYGSGKTITAFASWQNPTAGRTYVVTVSVRFPDGTSQEMSKSYAATSSTDTSLAPASMSLTLLSNLAAGTYTYSWTTKWGSNTVNSGSGSFSVG